jgi:hypothetical protein
MLNFFLEKDKTIPYSRSIKGYKNTGLVVKDFQRDILKYYISSEKKILATKDKEQLQDVYYHYDHPVSLLFEWVLENRSRNLIRQCKYCKQYFIAKRKDVSGCCPHHNLLIRAARFRTNRKISHE